MTYGCKSRWAILWVIAIVGIRSTLVANDRSTQSSPMSTLGKSIYDAKCSSCHGLEGKGDGNAAALLTPHPRVFTDGRFKFRTTESGSIPTDDDLMHTVKNGLHGTAMPDWDPFIRGDSLKAVIEYVKSFSARFKTEKPIPVKIGKPVPYTAASVAAGKRVFNKLQCAACHGEDGIGTGATTNEFSDDWGYEIRAANLTEPWTFRGGFNATDIYTRFRTGLDGTPMPSYKGAATEREMWDLANYIVSIGRKPVWSMNEKELEAFYGEQEKANEENPVDHGKYLVESLGCGYCHTPVRKDGSIVEELKYAGGQHWNLYPYGDYVSYNLTSDKETGLGGWTDDQITTFLTKGIRRDGSRMIPFPMPWTAYAKLKDSDLKAVIKYLRTLPAVYNKIPLPEKSNIFSYLWGKFKMLILKKDLPLRAYAGNTGTTKEKSISEAAMPAHNTGEEK